MAPKVFYSLHITPYTDLPGWTSGPYATNIKNNIYILCLPNKTPNKGKPVFLTNTLPFPFFFFFFLPSAKLDLAFFCYHINMHHYHAFDKSKSCVHSAMFNECETLNLFRTQGGCFNKLTHHSNTSLVVNVVEESWGNIPEKYCLCFHSRKNCRKDYTTEERRFLSSKGMVGKTLKHH